MAEDSGQEKTHEPTERRKQQFRDKGDIPKSKEVSGTIGLVTAVLVLAIFMQNIAFGIRACSPVVLSIPRGISPFQW